jgi:hypothetical protein
VHPARPHRSPRSGVAAQLGLLAVATAAYLAVRAVTQGGAADALANAHDVLALERRLGFDWERGVQAVALDHPTVVRICNAVYVWTFWPFVAGALVVLYVRDRHHYTRLRNALFASGAAGLVVFALFPVAPPRMLDGFTDTVAVVSGQDHLAHPSAFSNVYAAVPSFHVGWTVLAAVCLLPVLGHPVLRALALGHGAVMAVTVVVTANHYVVDAVAGIAVSLAGLAIAGRAAHVRRVLRRTGSGEEQRLHEAARPAGDGERGHDERTGGPAGRPHRGQTAVVDEHEADRVVQEVDAGRRLRRVVRVEEVPAQDRDVVVDDPAGGRAPHPRHDVATAQARHRVARGLEAVAAHREHERVA